MKTLDLSKLSSSERRRIGHIIEPRDVVLSLKFRGADIDAWKRAAEAAKESLTEWIERNANTAITKGKPKSRAAL